MKAAIQLTTFYLSALLILGVALSASLKSCAEEKRINSERAMAFQAQFQNANEQAVFVRKLGER